MSFPEPPARVGAARQIAAAQGFTQGCLDEVGRLLRAVAAGKPAGTIAESGTGTGIGTAWLHAGLGPAARLVTVERDVARAAAAAELFADDHRVRVLTGDWRLLAAHAPFDVFFCDGGGKDEPDRVIELLSPGGTLVLDDFTPSPDWPPRYRGEVDQLRLRYLTHPAVLATEVLTTPATSAILAVRRTGPPALG